jgi:hypothetical protein
MKRALLVAAGFAAGVFATYSFVHVQEARAAANRVYELRTYHTLPGRLPALQARFRDHTVKLFEKHGMKNIGYWTPADGPTAENTLIYVLSYDSREAAKKAWDGFRNDPDWKKAQQASEADGKIVEKVESVYMTPTEYSQLK